MVSQDYRSQNSPRPSRPRNFSRNDANHAVSSNPNAETRFVTLILVLNDLQSHLEDEWEDVETRRSSSPASSASRRRGRRSETAFVAAQPGSTRKRQWRQPAQPAKRRYYVELSEGGSDVDESAPPQPPPPPPPPPLRIEPAEQLQTVELAKEYATPIFRYLATVVADAFHLNRRVFSVALGITIVWLLASMMTSQLVFIARPMCSLPIISPRIPLCQWEAFKGPPTHTSAGRPVRWADYPKLIDVQTKTFDQLLDESVGNKGLSLDVKKAEMASNDLITLVRVSDLKSKDQIAERLSKFSDDARGTGRSLHSLGAKIQGAVDS